MRKRKAAPAAIEYNRSFEAHGRSLRFVENPEIGLRCVGYADKILDHLRHKGWYTYDDGDPSGTLRGVVYQLPARKGKEQYVYGYVETDTVDDGAVLCFDLCESKEIAARRADQCAESEAESERDFHRAWDAGRRVEALDEEIKEVRQEALALGTEARSARKVVGNMPVICEVSRDRIRWCYRRIQKDRKERKELFENFGREPGFVE